MTFASEALKELHDKVNELSQVVYNQLESAKDAFFGFDKRLALEVMHRERHVNSMELVVDRECEDILALYSPVAIDLRFVLASMKINIYLERVGDIANSIARYVVEAGSPFPQDVVEGLALEEMFSLGLRMFNLSITLYRKQKMDEYREVFELDRRVNQINKEAPAKLSRLLVGASAERVFGSTYVLSTVRKLERVGDYSKNIVEEVVFYLEARVLRHSKSGKTA